MVQKGAKEKFLWACLAHFRLGGGGELRLMVNYYNFQQKLCLLYMKGYVFFVQYSAPGTVHLVSVFLICKMD